jgi:hypothetical protein
LSRILKIKAATLDKPVNPQMLYQIEAKEFANLFRGGVPNSWYWIGWKGQLLILRNSIQRNVTCATLPKFLVVVSGEN